MPTGDLIIVDDDNFKTLQTASSTGDTLMSAGAVIAIDVALTDTDEKDYEELDFQLIITSGTPVQNKTIDVFLRAKGDGVNASPIPSTTFLQKPVFSFVLNNIAATSHYYECSIPNKDKRGSYYMLNNAGATLEIELKARGRTVKVV